MKKILRTMKWFREVGLIASDEQQRARHPEIDVEHLFLALTCIGGRATDALAAQGVTLDTARAAFHTLHRRRAAELGITLTADGVDNGMPEYVSRGGFVFRDGVQRLLEDAANAPEPDAALLRALLDEPSGHVRDVLRELDVDGDAFALDEDAGGEAQTTRNAEEYTRYVPASPEQVWALIADPRRWLEWNDFGIEHADVGESGIIRTRARERDLNGKPAKLRPEFRMMEHVVSRADAPRLIQWESTFPDAPKLPPRSLRIELAPSGTGTDVTFTLLTMPGSAKRMLPNPFARLGSALSQPVMVRGHLRGRTDNLARALRA